VSHINTQTSTVLILLVPCSLPSEPEQYNERTVGGGSQKTLL